MYMCMLCGESLRDEATAKRHMNDHRPITEIIERQRQEADEAWAEDMTKLMVTIRQSPEWQEHYGQVGL